MTHLPLYLLSPKILETSKVFIVSARTTVFNQVALLSPNQVLYVARNPKDVIVSYYHHHRLIKMHDFQGDLETFADYFMKDQCKCPSHFHI